MDGNTNGDYNQGSSCTHTDFRYWPWWMVDLGGEYSLSSVAVYNRIGANSIDLAHIYIMYHNHNRYVQINKQ